MSLCVVESGVVNTSSLFRTWIRVGAHIINLRLPHSPARFRFEFKPRGRRIKTSRVVFVGSASTESWINAHMCRTPACWHPEPPLSPESPGRGNQVGDWMRLKVKAFQFYLTLSLWFNMTPACVHMITESKKVDINRTDLTVSVCVCTSLSKHTYRAGCMIACM